MYWGVLCVFYIFFFIGQCLRWLWPCRLVVDAVSQSPCYCALVLPSQSVMVADSRITLKSGVDNTISIPTYL